MTSNKSYQICTKILCINVKGNIKIYNLTDQTLKKWTDYTSKNDIYICIQIIEIILQLEG